MIKDYLLNKDTGRGKQREQEQEETAVNLKEGNLLEIFLPLRGIIVFCPETEPAQDNLAGKKPGEKIP